MFDVGRRRFGVIGLSVAVAVASCLWASPAVADTTDPTDPAGFNRELQAEVEAAASDAIWTPPTEAQTVPRSTGPVAESVWTPPAQDRPLTASSSGKGGQTNLAPAGTTVGAPGLGALPYFTMEQFPLSDDTVAQVNVANGNLLITANDGTAASPGVGVRNDRFYNGLSTSGGALGGGWSSTMSYSDFGLAVNGAGTTATFYGPNGFRAIFLKSGSTWVAPAGFNATLTKTTDWYLKYNKTAETFRFDGTTQRLVAHYDRNGVGLTNNWAASSTAFTVTDAAGRVTTVNHVTGGPNINSVVDSAGRTTTYTRNGAGDLTQIDKPGGATTTMTYDTLHRLSTLTLPSAPGTTTITFGYDSSSRITSLTRQSSSPTWGSVPDVVTTFTYNAGSTIETNPNGNSATYTYDSSGRVTSTKDALNRAKSQTWTTNNDVQMATDAFGSGAGHDTTLSYDSLNNATGATLPTGAAASAVYALGASCPGGTTGDTYQVKCSTDPSGNTAGFTYDAAGNLTKKADITTGGTGAAVQQYTYENSSRTVCGGYAGQVCTSKDGNNNVTTYQYTGAGNLQSVTPPAPMGATTYTYDGLGRVTSVTDGRGKVTGYGYDLRDRLVQTTFDGGTTLSVTYYPNGSPQYQADSFTGTKQFEYDSLGHITKQIGALAGVTQKYNYDPAGNILTFEDATGVVTYVYDAANELTFQKEPGGTCPISGNPAANSGCTVFFYDANGKETRRVFPGGAQVLTTNDNSSRATRVQAKNAAGTVTADVSYSYTAGTSDTTLIQKRTSNLEQGITAGAVTSYSYDSLSRVTKAEEKAGSTVTASWTYGYDAAGNRTTQTKAGTTGSAAGTTIYSYNAATQLTGTNADTTTWTYDAAGNQTRNGITGATAAFGDRGQVQTLGSTNFTQFGQGNTEQLTATGGRNFAASAFGLERQTTAAGAVISYSQNANGQAVSFRNTASHYYVYDSLGSVIGVFSGAGAWEGGYSYSPSGESRFTGTSATITSNNVRYAGGYQESTNLYKLGARYYDASVGRFTQLDPSGQESNPYSYVSGNPVNATDISGLLGSVSCDFLFCTTSYTADDTELISAFGAVGVGLLSAGCTALTTAIGGAVCAAAFGSFVATANEAKNNGQCVAVRASVEVKIAFPLIVDC